jgi:hypothetical protein
MQTDPIVVGARSKNIAAVTNPAVGLYCVQPTAGIDASTRSWTVSAESSRSNPTLVYTAVTSDTGCPAGTLGVRTFKFAPSPTPHWTAAWDIAFMIVVP